MADKWQQDSNDYSLSSPYTGYSGFEDAYNAVANNGASYGIPGGTHAVVDTLDSAISTFQNLFQNFVGRAPTADEVNKYLSENAPSTITGSASSGPQGSSYIRNNTASYIGDTFQQAANDTANQKLQAQQGQANDLASLFRTQGQQAISDTEQNLMDYQSKLFEKLRPNLITSLDSQGLLDTGGLNQALAGAQQNLADSAQGYLINANLNNDNAANQIAFGGASAPYYFQQNQIMNQPNNLLQAGQGALNTNNNTYLTNLNAINQAGLMQQQKAIAGQAPQPSFLQSLGNSFASSVGNSAGQWFGPGAYSSSAGGASGASGLGSMLFA